MPNGIRACPAMRRALAMLCMALAAPLAAAAADASRPRTCLVLGGGGARGAAHIGVLKVLEREKVPVDCVVGTSMGAIVGGLYAAGYDADAIEDILRRIDWNDVLQDNPARGQRSMRAKDDDLRFLGGIEIGVKRGGLALPQGMIQGQNLQLLLRRLFLPVWRIQDFDRLPIPYRAIAADIASGQKVVFAHGDIATAIRASMSIPGAFAPIRVDGQLLVDGGMVDNVPIDEARRLGAQRLIVVEVGSGLEPEKSLDSPYAIARQMLVAVLKRQSDAQIASLGPDDLVIAPDLGSIATQDFNRSAEAMARGEAAAAKLADRLRRYAGTADDYAAFQARHALPAFDPGTIDYVDVAGEQSKTSAYVAHRLSPHVGRPLDVDTVERSISAAYGEGRYQAIPWRLEQDRDGRTGIVLEPSDKSWGPAFLRNVLRLSDDFAGNSGYQLLSELNLTGLNSLGGEARFRLGFGRLTNAHTEFYQPFGDRGQFSVSPYLDYRAYNVPVVGGGKTPYAQFRRVRAVGGIEWAWTPSNAWIFALSMERGRDKALLHIGDPTVFGNQSSDIGSVALRITRDTLDSSGFPSRGSRFNAVERYYLTALGSAAAAHVTQLSWDGAWSWGRNRWLLGVKYAASEGGTDQLASYSPLGGLTNLSGYAENDILAAKTFLGRIVYYRRLNRADTLLSLPVYVGGSLEAAAWGNRQRNILRGHLVPAGSLFVGADTFLGPIFLGYGQADKGMSAFYLTFGPLLRTETGY